MIKSVFKPSRIKDGKRVRSRVYWGQYRLDIDDPITRVSLKTTDKRVAEQRLNELVAELQYEQAGLVVPRTMKEAGAKPVADHLQDLIADLQSRGRSNDYIRKIDSRCRALITTCDWKRLGDVTPDSFINWRSAADLAPKTLNHYLDAAMVLMSWLVSINRIAENPLQGVIKVETRGRETVQRRAFTDEEMKRLMATCGKRWPIYLIASQTGLRFNEMRALRWQDVRLENQTRPVIQLRSSTTKNRKSDTIPLTPVAVEALQHVRRPNAKATDSVFDQGMPSHHTVTADIERAGIEKKNDTGHQVDFHALRMTFITNLQRAGVQRRVVMALARHSDSRLTDGTYTDADALPLTDALAQLPKMDLPLPVKTAQGDAQRDAKTAQRDAQRMVSDRAGVSRDGTGHLFAKVSQSPFFTVSNDEQTCHTLTECDRSKNGAGGNRTPVPESSAQRLYVCSHPFNLDLTPGDDTLCFDPAS